MTIRKLVLASPGMKELIVSVNDAAPLAVIQQELRAIWRSYHRYNIPPEMSDRTAGPELIFPLGPR